MKFNRTFWINTFFAWLLFLGIDFLFHAGILKLFWTEEIPAIKPLEELAALIPMGYLSFFLLTTLIGFTFVQIFPKKPKSGQLVRFALIWGLLFSLSNLLGLYSYVEIPLLQLTFFNLVYFLETTSVCFVFNLLLYNQNRSRVRLLIVFLFFAFVILGIVLQNLIQ